MRAAYNQNFPRALLWQYFELNLLFVYDVIKNFIRTILITKKIGAKSYGSIFLIRRISRADVVGKIGF